MSGMITISQESFNSLIKESIFLECLESEGVDNWIGYEYAKDAYQERIKEEGLG